jgi:guanylate kinase
VNGREYHFVSDEAFDAMVAHGELLEWAQFAGQKYGTPKAPVEERAAAGVPTLLEIDIEGARQVRRSVPGALLIFPRPRPARELASLTTGRGTEPPDVIERRLIWPGKRSKPLPRVRYHVGQHVRQEVCKQLVT